MPLAAARPRSPGSTSPTSTPPSRPVPELVAAGATRGRADGRAGADRRQLQHARARPRTGASCRPSRRRCWSSSAPTTTAELDALRGAARASCSPADELLRPADFTRDARADRGLLARARGHARARRQAAPAGHGADHRGRLRAAGADRRGGAATSRRCSASTASCPASPATPRPGNLHFMLTPDVRRAGGPRALRGVHGRARRADRRQVRRLAEGRARHRRQHGALRRARVGRRRRPS